MATQDFERVDKTVKEVADEWAALSDKEKLQLLYEIRTATEADAVRGNDKHDHLRLSGYATGVQQKKYSLVGKHTHTPANRTPVLSSSSKPLTLEMVTQDPERAVDDMVKEVAAKADE
ncbi:hypothetical protein DIPPA_21301 [Diplonema papillatum]|nr:hypothetical protein DIPPA_21301 [Diplonema papillatum]